MKHHEGWLVNGPTPQSVFCLLLKKWVRNLSRVSFHNIPILSWIHVFFFWLLARIDKFLVHSLASLSHTYTQKKGIATWNLKWSKSFWWTISSSSGGWRKITGVHYILVTKMRRLCIRQLLQRWGALSLRMPGWKPDIHQWSDKLKNQHWQ